MTSLARSADAPTELLDLLTEWSQSAADDATITASIYRSHLHASMGGQLFVRDIEVPEADGKVQLSLRLVLDQRQGAFFDLEFREAIEAFLARRIVTPEAWREMDSLARRAAFSGTHLATEAVVQRVRSLLEATLRDGGTLRDFQSAITPADLGIVPSAPAYIENVYRTTIQSSYGTGRLQQLEQPAVVAARPYVQYRTAGDNRVRARHRALNGLTFDRSNDPGWRRYAPPLGYQCRCAMVTVRTPGTITNSTTLADDIGPDPGWVGPGGS